MSRLKYLHDNYSPSQELWAMMGECTALQDALDEIAAIDRPVKHKKEYHSIFVKLDDIKSDLIVLRSVASRSCCSSLLIQGDDPDDLPFE